MIFRFGSFDLDTQLLELRRDDIPVPIEPQAFNVLRLLIENRDRLVSKDDLIDNAWDGRIVSEATLSSCMNAVRRAVGDDGKRQKVIRTLPRRGFRFVLPVAIDDEASAVTDGQRAVSPEIGLRSPESNSASSIPDKPAIAVLPFRNLSGDPDQEYFADGLTEDIITTLSLWRSFPVIARNSSFAFKGQSSDIRKVGKELGARYVIEGSVRKSDDHVRVTAQLIDAETGHHVWAERYDRDLADIFELQDELTQSIAGIVAPEVERTEHRRLRSKESDHLDAWDFVLRGMASLSELTKEGNVRARELFKKAIDLDPDYSRPYTGLGWSRIRDVSLGFTESRQEDLAAGLTEARRAIVLNASDPLAHSVLSIGYMNAGASDLSISEAEEAVRLNPSDAIGYLCLGHNMSIAGRAEEGIPFLEKGFRLNPYDPQKSFFLCFMSRAKFNVHLYDEAIEWARKSIELRPDAPEPHLLLAVALGHFGRTEEAQAELETCERLDPDHAKKGGSFSYNKAADTEHFLQGLRKAGWEG